MTTTETPATRTTAADATTAGSAGADTGSRAATTSTAADASEHRWVDVAAVDELTPGRGVAALVDGHQVAIFRLEDDTVLAVDNYDPFSGTHVLSRGIVGDRTGVPKVASPIYKQSFDLRTGRCLDDASVRIRTYPVRVAAGRVEVASPARPARPARPA